jgi:hypothetical protein
MRVGGAAGFRSRSATLPRPSPGRDRLHCGPGDSGCVARWRALMPALVCRVRRASARLCDAGTGTHRSVIDHPSRARPVVSAALAPKGL